MIHYIIQFIYLLVTISAVESTVYAAGHAFGPGVAAKKASQEIDAVRSFRDRRKKTKEEKIERRRITLRTMDFDELEVAYRREIASGDLHSAARFLEQMVKKCDDIEKIADLMVELADIYFNLQDTAKASKLYQRFISLYQGHDKYRHALAHSVFCAARSLRGDDRDQTATYETLKLANDFLALNADDLYKDEILTIKDRCCSLIAHNELNIGNFYLDRGNILAASKRFEGIEKEWLALAPSIEPLLSESKQKLASMQPVTITVVPNTSLIEDTDKAIELVSQISSDGLKDTCKKEEVVASREVKKEEPQKIAQSSQTTKRHASDRF